jgi:hypothetical protein
MPSTFQAAQAELIDLRSALAILQASGREYGARVLTDAIDKLEAQLGINQVRH